MNIINIMEASLLGFYIFFILTNHGFHIKEDQTLLWFEGLAVPPPNVKGRKLNDVLAAPLTTQTEL